MESTTQEEFHHVSSDQHHKKSFLPKGRRTKRPRSSTTSSNHGGGGGGCSDTNYSSSYSTATDDHDIMSDVTTEEEDMANCLILLAQGMDRPVKSNTDNNNNINITSTSTSNINIINGVYECKTCNRTFPSFQALGGHRASHKKPKPNPIVVVRPPSNYQEGGNYPSEDLAEPINNDNNNTTTTNNNKARVHECSICGSEFPSGQALGGHMRRHRAPPPASCPIPIIGGGPKNFLPLDLNLPAPEDDDHMEAKFHVLATPALVDCHY